MLKYKSKGWHYFVLTGPVKSTTSRLVLGTLLGSFLVR